MDYYIGLLGTVPGASICNEFDYFFIEKQMMQIDYKNTQNKYKQTQKGYKKC